MMNTYQSYKILGLKDDAPFKEVKSAYRKLVLEFHPDKNMSEKDGKQFKMVAEAYQFLKTQHKRETTSRQNSRKSNDKNSKDSGFNSKSSWGAKSTDRSPQEDWSKYTKQTEYAYQDFWKYYEKTFWEYYEKTRAEVKVEAEPEEEEKDMPVSVEVDHSRCIACCSCETIAPAVFAVDKHTHINPKSNVINDAGAKSEKILDAAQTCPTKAISVSEKESQRRLYPW